MAEVSRAAESTSQAPEEALAALSLTDDKANNSSTPSDDEAPPRAPSPELIYHAGYEPVFRKHLEEYTCDKGPGHPEIMEVMARLANCGKFEEALPMARHQLTFHQRLHGEEHPDLVSLLDALAACLRGLGQHEEAEKHYISALNVAQRTQGHEHPTTLRCCGTLGMHWLDMGKREKAEGMMRRVVDFNARVGPTVQGYLNLGTCLVGMPDKVEEGLELLRQALELSVEVNGLEHAITANIMHSLARGLENSGDYAEAEVCLERMRQLSINSMGSHSPLTLWSVYDLSRVLMLQHRFEDALPVCRQALRLHQRVYGADHPSTLHLFVRLGEILGEMGRFDQAQPIAEQALQDCTRVLGPGHEDTKSAVAMVKELDKVRERQAQIEQFRAEVLGGGRDARSRGRGGGSSRGRGGSRARR